MSKYSRFLILILCCVLVVSVVVQPLTVEASGPAIAFGLTVNELFTVGATVFACCLILYATSRYFPSTSQLIDDAKILASKLSSTSLAFIENVGVSLINGTESAKALSADVVADVNAALKEMYGDEVTLPVAFGYLVRPSDLRQLSTVSPASVFVSEVTGILSEQVSLTQKIAGVLNDVKIGILSFPSSFASSISSLSDTFTSKIDSLSSSFNAEFKQFKSWYAEINSNLKSEVHQIPNWLSSINTNMKSEFKQIKGWLSDINTNIKNEILGLKTILLQIKDTAFGAVTSAIDNIGVKIDSLIDVISATFVPGFNGNQENNENANNTVDSGIRYMFPILGSGRDYLAEHYAGFLAAGLIFNEFADIPFINQLIFISISIGILGVFLGSALNVAQSASIAGKEAARAASKASRSQKTRSQRKGG